MERVKKILTFEVHTRPKPIGMFLCWHQQVLKYPGPGSISYQRTYCAALYQTVVNELFGIFSWGWYRSSKKTENLNTYCTSLILQQTMFFSIKMQKIAEDLVSVPRLDQRGAKLVSALNLGIIQIHLTNPSGFKVHTINLFIFITIPQMNSWPNWGWVCR